MLPRTSNFLTIIVPGTRPGIISGAAGAAGGDCSKSSGRGSGGANCGDGSGEGKGWTSCGKGSCKGGGEEVCALTPSVVKLLTSPITHICKHHRQRLR